MKIEHPAVKLGKKIVVIVGGGFGGLNAAKALQNKPGIEVVLIDQRNHHLFQPLLYQVATAGLNPADIAAPIRAQFGRAKNISVHWGRVEDVDLATKTIRTIPGRGSRSEEIFEFGYDFLIVACGSQHSYFAHPEWENLAPGLKTLEQATEIRRRILSAFERAENEFDKEKQKALLNFVVVGGGPTGVELAGAIADISRTVLVKDFRRIDPSQARIILVEGGERLLASFTPSLSARAEKDLRELGVEVRTSSRVEQITDEGVQVGKDFIASSTVLWAAGVRAARIDFVPPVKADRAGRVLVEKDLSVPEWRDVFVIGDMAAAEIAPGQYVPGLAPAAIQGGRHAAKMILASLAGRPRRDFKYLDKGQMATIGKRRAVLQAGRIQMTGLIAWIAWIFVHILYLIGFKNRIVVLAEWAWSYLAAKRGSRLITDRDWKLYERQ